MSTASLGVIINGIQVLDPLAVTHRIEDKIHTPDLIRASGFAQGDTGHCQDLAPLGLAHREAHLSVESIGAFVVNRDSLSSEHHLSAAIAKAAPLLGKINNPCP
jgi:hypothetical protein